MIILKQFDGANVTPADDAALYAHLDARSGIISGVEIAHLGANQISIGAGRGIVCGRTFVIEAETVLATLSASGTQNGRLLLQIDLGNADAPASFITQAAAVLPDLVQEDLNEGGTLYQLVLATYTVNTTTISGLSAVAPLASIFGANGAIPLAAGGTGAVTALAARKNIGAKVYFSLAELGITAFPTTMSEVCSKMPTQSIAIIDSRNIISEGAEEISDLGLGYSGMYVFFKGNTVSRFSMLFISGSVSATAANMYFGCYASTSGDIVWERPVKNVLNSNDYGSSLPDPGTPGRVFFKKV